MSEEVDEPPPLPTELTLTAGAPANGGSCVARHEGRVVFVRYALPGETVKVRVVGDHGSYWHADVVEVIEPSPTASTRCARSRAWTAPVAAIWRSPNPMPRAG